jgi:preprotein translocase subunit SecG
VDSIVGARIESTLKSKENNMNQTTRILIMFFAGLIIAATALAEVSIVANRNALIMWRARI